jgi:hypothetical protein
LCFAAVSAIAEEPTPAPAAATAASESPPAAAESGSAPVATAESPSAAATVADPAVAPASPHKVLLLPLTFTVYQSGVGSFEAVPDWTEAARKNLSESARSVVTSAGGFELEPMPELPPDESRKLRDHVALARLIAFEGTHYKSKFKKDDWHSHRADFDRSFGDGLKFLHDRTGADYALLIDGSQIRQSGGSIFMQLLLAAGGVMVLGGGGTVVSACLIDLNTGQVAWFNSSLSVAILGMTKADLRDLPTAQKSLSALFMRYPAIPAFDD